MFADSQGAFATALLDAARPVPAGVTGPGGGADAARFAVYRNNVFVGLTKALGQRFAVSGRLVGEEFFTAMARAYAQDHKPATPLIMDYGDDFPDFVAGFGPAGEIAYLPDVARLEVAWSKAYHAADAACLPLAALAAVAPEELPELRLAPHPSAALIASPHPVGSIWAAHQLDEVRPPEDWQPETVLVVRPGFEVGVHILPPRDAAFAEALFAGLPLGEAAQIAAGRDPAFEFGTALAGLLGLGAFGRIHHRHDSNEGGRS